MKNETLTKKLNLALNTYLEKEHLKNGGVRYFPKEIITVDMVADEELLDDMFKAVQQYRRERSKVVKANFDK